MGSLIASLIGGPITGLLGSAFGIFGKWMEARERRKDRELEQAHELKLQQLNIQARGQELEQESLIAERQASADMLAASYRHDASFGEAHRWVVDVLRLMRPLFTIMLIMLTGIIFWKASDGAAQHKIIATILYMTEVALTWWFADRARERKK